MKNFDQFELTTTEMNNVEGGTFGLLGLLGGCYTAPTCAPKPSCAPAPVVCTPPKPVCQPAPVVCAPKPTYTAPCLPKISFSFSFSFGCK